ncbi:DUF5995 family protein [Gordonia jinhuaensis]|uniref:Uncharacterized protein n=1 Tax=Gordonia jinhuaensis TaxID=1517702 RepID=A0A916T4L6_9ACTN|nr:DUF5995 family protein [Gordonia jinhuaensis]GGB31277.1 hypothetical protein GCM10011489_19340 [Gordonia jinhuaensis]
MRRIVSIAVSMCCAATVLAGDPAGASAQPPAGCATLLSAADVAQVSTLSAPPPAVTGTAPLDTLTDHVWRLSEISDILVRNHDRRGLFTVGLAATEHAAVLPLETSGTLADPTWAQRLSVLLLDRYLAAVHAEFTGGVVPAHWQRYFTLGDDCSVSGVRAAATGYNGHITVDLAYAVADSAATRANAADFYRIVDAIAAHGDAIVDATERDYGVDLGPTFRFYFLGEGLDRLVGAGRASNAMLRAADVGYNVLTFESGLALQNPSTRRAAVTSVNALWSTGDAALGAADDLGVLELR